MVNHSLQLGVKSGSSGTYNLSGIGELSSSFEVIGFQGTSIFNQNGGTNTVTNNLYLGVNPTGDGTYNLSDGKLSSMNETIGLSGTGIFNQSGGTTLYYRNFTDLDGSYSGGTLSYFYMGTGPGTAPVPEPSTYILLDTGIAGLIVWRRKRKLAA